MTTKMRAAFEKLFPQHSLPPLANSLHDSTELSHRLLLDAAANGDYAKHCMSFLAGAESRESEIRRLQGIIDYLKTQIKKEGM